MKRRTLFAGIAALIGGAGVLPTLAIAEGDEVAATPKGFWTLPPKTGAFYEGDTIPGVWVNIDYGSPHSHSFMTTQEPTHAHYRPARMQDFASGT